MKKVFFLLFFVITGCVSYDRYYRLDENYLARRQLETRRFETNNEESMLIASAQVLQDLGFTIEESETKLGLITGSKDREAGSAGQTAAMVFLAVLARTPPVYDTNQKIYVTLVSTRAKNQKGYNIRIEFARVIWNNRKEARIEKIQDNEIYQDFFDKLSQSVFLTAHDI